MSLTLPIPDAPPTTLQYGSLQAAYDYFNEKLFDNELAPCMITLQHHRGANGYFHAEQWRTQEEKAQVLHQITLNPHQLHRGLRETLGTLVHEMCHLWQQDHGKPSRRAYHNKEWGTKMKAVGLYPSSTAEPGGKETGQKMSHYILEGGAYEYWFHRMPDAIKLPWIGACAAEKKKNKKANKVKYCCPSCDLNAWGKAGLALKCVDCDEELISEED